MTEEQVRELVAGALEYASVFTLRDKGLTQAFIAGREDVRLGELEMDSLAVMELCIAIEVNTGVSIVPTDLESMESLSQLVAAVVKPATPAATTSLPREEVPRSKKLGNGTTGLYARLKQSCRTVNELHKIRVLLENRMSPLELANFQIDALEPADQDWVKRLHLACAQSGKKQPEPFLRIRLSPNITFYGSEEGRSAKTLAVCYTGHAQRMMMPLPIFLQHLNAGNTDVLLLRDNTKSGYRKGIEGVGHDIESTIDGIRELLPIDDYQRTVSIGTSGGGLPAVLTALRLSMDAAMSIGGNSPLDPRWLKDDGTPGKDILLRNLNESNPQPTIFYAFGSGADKDQEAAIALQDILPAELIRIGDDVNKVGHAALDPIFKQGKLGEFLEFTIFRAAPR